MMKKTNEDRITHYYDKHDNMFALILQNKKHYY